MNLSIRIVEIFEKHQETYDLIVDLQGNMQSALVCKSARKSRGAEVLGPSFQTEGACFIILHYGNS